MNKKDQLRKFADKGNMLIIFIAVLIFWFSLYTSEEFSTSNGYIGRFTHTKFWFPLQSIMIELLLGFSLLYKCWRFNACSLTWIATLLLICLSCLSIVLLIFPTLYSVLLSSVTIIILIGIGIIILLYIIQKWMSKL